MSVISITQRPSWPVTSRSAFNHLSPNMMNVVTPVTLRSLTRCAGQGRGSTVKQ
jgi:hypothetical protein